MHSPGLPFNGLDLRKLHVLVCIVSISLIMLFCTRFGGHVFRVAGPSVWNSLPADLRHPDLSLGQFRKALKTLFLTGSAAPSDCLLLGAAYKCTYLLTSLLTI